MAPRAPRRRATASVVVCDNDRQIGLVFKHFEIASYRSLRSAAEYLGDHETARVCDEILRDEEAMAEYLSQHISSVTQEYLGVQAREASR